MVIMGSGTGPTDLATAGPKLQKPTIQNFNIVRYTDNFIITNNTTYFLCKIIALL